MIISIVGFVVNHAPLVLTRHVPQPVIEIWKGIPPLPVSVGQWFPNFLVTSIEVWIPKPMPGKNSDHGPHCKGSHPPIVKRWWVAHPSMKEFLVEKICDRRVRLS